VGYPAILKTIAQHFPIGDWFIIYQIGKNMDPFVFGELLEKLDEKFDEVPEKRPLY
jgi:hypothetical protein